MKKRKVKGPPPPFSLLIPSLSPPSPARGPSRPPEQLPDHARRLPELGRAAVHAGPLADREVAVLVVAAHALLEASRDHPVFLIQFFPGDFPGANSVLFLRVFCVHEREGERGSARRRDRERERENRKESRQRRSRSRLRSSFFCLAAGRKRRMKRRLQHRKALTHLLNSSTRYSISCSAIFMALAASALLAIGE